MYSRANTLESSHIVLISTAKMQPVMSTFISIRRVWVMFSSTIFVPCPMHIASVSASSTASAALTARPRSCLFFLQPGVRKMTSPASAGQKIARISRMFTVVFLLVSYANRVRPSSRAPKMPCAQKLSVRLSAIKPISPAAA